MKTKNEWPYNFLCYMLSHKEIPEDLPDDIEISVDYLMHILRKHDQQQFEIVSLRFVNKMPYVDIAKKLSINYPMCRKKYEQAIDFLLKPNQFRIIIYGITKAWEIDIKRAVYTCYADIDETIQAINAEKESKEKQEAFDREIDNRYSIWDLNLSTHTLNFLRRSNITFSQLLHMDRKQFLNIRGIGVASLNEVVRELERLGFNVNKLKYENWY